MEWLTRPLMADGVVVAEPLDPARLTDAELPSVCVRMYAILNSVEKRRCEGRLIQTSLFDQIDTLATLVRQGPSPHWHDWVDVVREFGTYYQLEGTAPIVVDQVFWRDAMSLSGAPAV